jgi:hypothetical protein
MLPPSSPPPQPILQLMHMISSKWNWRSSPWVHDHQDGGSWEVIDRCLYIRPLDPSFSLKLWLRRCSNQPWTSGESSTPSSHPYLCLLHALLIFLQILPTDGRANKGMEDLASSHSIFCDQPQRAHQKNKSVFLQSELIFSHNSVFLLICLCGVLGRAKSHATKSVSNWVSIKSN